MSYWQTVFAILWFLSFLPSIVICDWTQEHWGIIWAIVFGLAEVLNLAGLVKWILGLAGRGQSGD